MKMEILIFKVKGMEVKKNKNINYVDYICELLGLNLYWYQKIYLKILYRKENKRLIKIILKENKNGY